MPCDGGVFLRRHRCRLHCHDLDCGSEGFGNDLASYRNSSISCSLMTFCLLFDRIFGSSYLTQQGIAHDSAWDLWQNIMALGIIAIGVLFIAYIQLRRIKKLK